MSDTIDLSSRADAPMRSPTGNELVVAVAGAELVVIPVAELASGGGGSAAWGDITGKPPSFPPAAHAHAIADVTGLGDALAAKADAAAVTAVLSDKAALASPALTGTPTAPTAAAGTDSGQIATTAFVKAAVDAIPGGGGGSTAWGDITGKPSSFPPAVHDHAIADVTGLAAALAAKADAAAIPAVPAIAAVATVRAGTSAADTLGVKNTLDAHAPVALTDAATITVDLAAGIVFALTLGGNRTLGAPANQIAGRSGLILVKQDATGSRTLSFAADWKFLGGAPDLSTAAGAVDVIAWYVEASGTVRASFLKGG